MTAGPGEFNYVDYRANCPKCGGELVEWQTKQAWPFNKRLVDAEELTEFYTYCTCQLVIRISRYGGCSRSPDAKGPWTGRKQVVKPGEGPDESKWEPWEVDHWYWVRKRIPEGKPSVPQVLPLVREYYRIPGNGAGGSLHILLDDNNVEDSSVDFCLKHAQSVGDRKGAELAEVLRRMSKTQRNKVASSKYKRPGLHLETRADEDAGGYVQ